MPELESQLRALAADMVWPATPDLQAAVMTRSQEEHTPSAHRVALVGGRRRLLTAVLAAFVLLPAAGALAFPRARDDVLAWLGLRNVTVRRISRPLPAARPQLEADLGRLSTLSEAERAAGFRAALPAALGAPDRVRISSRRISLIYTPRPGLPELDGVRAGLIITESPGGIRGEYLKKLLLSDTSVERVDVRGRHGAFISGGQHAYLYETPEGEVREERPLLAGPTLIWGQGGLVLRLETAAGRATALRVSRTVGR